MVKFSLQGGRGDDWKADGRTKNVKDVWTMLFICLYSLNSQFYIVSHMPLMFTDFNKCSLAIDGIAPVSLVVLK